MAEMMKKNAWLVLTITALVVVGSMTVIAADRNAIRKSQYRLILKPSLMRRHGMSCTACSILYWFSIKMMPNQWHG
jgi:hypothetical protein